MPRSAEELWEGFAKATIPLGASATQRREMMRSFYSGMLGVFCEQLRMGHLPSEQFSAAMEALYCDVRFHLERIIAEDKARMVQ